MKTRTLSIIFSTVLIGGLLFLVQKNLNCQSNQLNVGNPDTQGSVVSIPNPSNFPDASPLFSEMWSDPQFLVLRDIPEGLKRHFIGQPELTTQEIYLPVLGPQPGILIYSKDGNVLNHIRFESAVGVDITDIQILPASREILVGDNTNKVISVYDLSGRHVEDRNVGFHFLSFSYNDNLDRYIFYIASDGKVASPASPPNAITLTDADFKVLHTFFPLPARTMQAPLFVDERFKQGDNVVYYNPDYSDQLYAIDFKGNIELFLDLQMADAAYYHRLDSMVARGSNSIDQLMALKQSLCIDFFVGNDDYMIVGRIPTRHNKDLIVNRQKTQGLLIGNSILLTNYGDRFSFGYCRPDFATRDSYLKIFSGDDFNTIMRGLPEDETTSHLPAFLEDNQWLLIKYNPNDEVLFPDAQKASTSSQISLNVFPNPANESVSIKVEGVQKNIQIDVFSTDGTLRYSESNLQSEDGLLKELKVADWSPGAYVVKCTTSDAVHARTLLVQR